jgi:hypothetical protein
VKTSTTGIFESDEESEDPTGGESKEPRRGEEAERALVSFLRVFLSEPVREMLM